MKLSALNVASIAIFAAFQALLSIFPFTITVGVSGQITLGVIGGSLIGILLGPITGGISVLIGSLAGVFLNPAGALFGIFTIIPPFLGAFGAGCIKIKKGYLAGLVILTFLVIFYAHPSGQVAYVYPWLHIIGLIVAFSPLAHLAGSTFSSPETTRLIFGIEIAAFIGVITDHIVGSSIAIWYFSPYLTPEILYTITPIYPIERLVALIIASVIAAPVYYSMVKAGYIQQIEQE